MSADLPPIAPLDVPSAAELPAPPAAPALPTPPDAAPSGTAGGPGPQAAPSAFGGGPVERTPSVTIAQYDPHTGRYVGPDGKLYQQSDLVAPKAPKTWQEMFPT